MPDSQVSGTDLARIRAREVIADELGRAGIPYSEEFLHSLADAYLAGDASNSNVVEMQRLIDMGQGKGRTAANQGVPYEEAVVTEPFFGAHDPEITWQNQRAGWDGHGWTGEKIRQYGRNPEPREMSAGGRRANTWAANQQFLSGLLKAKERGTEAHSRESGAIAGQTFGLVSNPSTADEYVAREMRALADEHNRVRSQTHGESGWLGAIENPEYMAGYVANTIMQPFADAASLQWNDPSPRKPGQPHHWMDRYTNVYYPKAAALATARRMARMVEPVMPAGKGVEEGNWILADLASRTGPSFDLEFRKKFGFWPSYALSSLAWFGNALLDPTLLASPAAPKVAQAIGKAALRAGNSLAPRLLAPGQSLGDLYKAAAKLAHPDWGGTKEAMQAVNAARTRGAKAELAGMLGIPTGRQSSALSDSLRSYGLHLRKMTRDRANSPIAEMLLADSISEVPQASALGGAVQGVARQGEPTVFGFTNDPKKEAGRSMGPLPTNPFGYGAARTDLYRQVVDPSTGKIHWKDWSDDAVSEAHKEQSKIYYDRDTLPDSRLGLLGAENLSNAHAVEGLVEASKIPEKPKRAKLPNMLFGGLLAPLP